MEEVIRWLPLESNPDVMNKFIRNLGVSSNWQLVDVLGLDPEMLQMVPRPVLAVLLLFPTSDKYEDFCKSQVEEIKAEGQTLSEDVYFIKQTISNACGTIALIHAVANNQGRIQLDSSKCLKKFFDETKDMTPEEKGAHLEKNEEISNAHLEFAQEGQTSAPDPDEAVNLHFVTLLNVDNTLYELDGRKPFPINHGATAEDSFVEDAANVCKKFMERDPDEVHFTVVALTAAHGDHN